MWMVNVWVLLMMMILLIYEKMYEYDKKDDIDLLEFGFQKIKENKNLKNLKYKIKYKEKNN